MMSYFLTIGRGCCGPRATAAGYHLVGDRCLSSHVVTFRRLGPSNGDAQIFDDIDAAGLYVTLGKPYDIWPTAAGHVTAPHVPGVSSELLRSSGSGCFTLAGLPTAADSNPPGLLVDLRATAAPRVETMPTAKLAGRCP
jgi:hypothetical protein